MTELDDQPSSLLDWVAGLASDPAGRARLTEDPRSVLFQQGLADLPPSDLQHVLPLVTDVVAARLGVDVDTVDVPAPQPGEDPVSVLARQFGGVADHVRGVGVPPGEPADGPSDPFDVLDAPVGPDDEGADDQDHDLDDLGALDDRDSPAAEPVVPDTQVAGSDDGRADDPGALDALATLDGALELDGTDSVIGLAELPEPAPSSLHLDEDDRSDDESDTAGMPDDLL